MSLIKASAGNESQKSDCRVTIVPAERGGLDINIQSKVETLYGDTIDTLVTSVLGFYEIEHARVEVIDNGALDFTIASRTEAAARQLSNIQKDFPLDFPEAYKTKTDKFRRRFSRLYLPGNSPKLFINAGLYKPDAIILDLEDSVAMDKKDEARILVRNALRQVNFYGTERMVRINQLPLGLTDLEAIVPQFPNLILIPKAENAGQVVEVENKVLEIMDRHNMEHNIWFMPIIESALGVIHAFDIATSSQFISALAIGLEDYTADLGVRRSCEGTESFFARSAIVNAAKAAGIQAIDSVFSDVDDTEGLTQSIQTSKQLGFEGMGCIHPRQIAVIHENFAPSNDEIEKAKKIVLAFREAEARGLGVVSLGSKMIDPPVVKRALQTIEIAIETNKLKKGWDSNKE